MLARGGGVRIDRLAEAGAPEILGSRELIGREGRGEDRQAGSQRLRDGVVAAVRDDDVAHPEGGHLGQVRLDQRPGRQGAEARGIGGAGRDEGVPAEDPDRVGDPLQDVRPRREEAPERDVRPRSCTPVAGNTLDERVGDLRPDAGAQEPRVRESGASACRAAAGS